MQYRHTVYQRKGIYFNILIFNINILDFFRWVITTLESITGVKGHLKI